MNKNKENKFKFIMISLIIILGMVLFFSFNFYLNKINSPTILFKENIIYIKIDESYKLEDYLKNENFSKKIVFESNNLNIVTVDEFGVISGLNEGMATITATILGTNIKDSVTVVVDFKKIPTIELNKTSINMQIGNSDKIIATILNSNDNQTIIWSSSNTSVASVDTNGIVKANKEGSAIITVTIKGTNIMETVKVEVSKKQEPSITLNKTSFNMEIGNSDKIIATILNSNDNQTIIWSSSNPNIATVDKNGNVKAISPGTATITAKIKDTNISREVKVTVSEIKATSIALNTTNINIKINESYQLNANVIPENATNKEIIWTSSNPSIATVDSNGYVKAINIGNVIIKAKVKNTNIEKSVSVNVSKINVTSIKLNKTTTTLQIGKYEQLISTIEPNNATNKNITWSSNNQQVAIVDSNGKIHALNKGVAIITATVDGKTANCEVIVNNISFTWNDGVETLITTAPGAPRVYTLKNGNLIAGYESRGTNGKLEIKTAISKDNGKTWSNITIASFKEKRDCANINFFIDGNNLYMAYRAVGENATSLQLSVSHDNGITWQHHSTIIENKGRTDRGVWEPYLGILNNQLTCFYANDIASSSYQNIEYLVWNGNSWTNKTIVSNGKNHNSRDGMPVWTKLSTGEYIVIIESSKYRKNNYPFILQLIYSDDGINWSNPVDLYIPTTKKSKAAAPGIIEIPSTNQLVISFQTDEDSTKKGDGYSVMKSIYSTISFKDLKQNIKSGNSITNKFSPSENIFKTPNGAATVWTGIHYKNGWLYAAAGGSSNKQSGSLLKKIYIG